MKFQSKDVILAVIAGMALFAGLALGAWTFLGPAPPPPAPAQLNQSQLQHKVRELAESNKFDEAEKLASGFLAHDPKSASARLMLAEIALNRPEPQNEQALELLRTIKPDNQRMAAQVQLDRGKAYYRLSRFDEAEAGWKEAIRLDPTIAEAGWSLLDLYYVQGRKDDAHRLGLQLFSVEPDQHDQAQLLLELVRQDAQPADPASVAKLFERVLERDSDDLHTRIALGLALVRNSRADQGVELLRKVVAAHPQDADAWDALLMGLGIASQSEGLAEALDRLPPELAKSPRFAKHNGRLAWDRRDWKAAAEAYRRAWEVEPNDHEILYRLGGALRNAGDVARAEPIENRARAFEKAREGLSDLYEEANAVKTLGTENHPELYRKLADNREMLGRYGEARAWLRMILRYEPFEEETMATLKRLDAEHPEPSAARPGP
ncbi:MAG TPA: tetratricopeptide repeat protein [Isosphaeraceae bacterium]|jgi:tetratricopeptide (TPR) repeat protein|nr:tetratricopeptide repeat protein [Isosphaeraceae bacterium]